MGVKPFAPLGLRMRGDSHNWTAAEQQIETRTRYANPESFNSFNLGIIRLDHIGIILLKQLARKVTDPRYRKRRSARAVDTHRVVVSRSQLTSQPLQTGVKIWNEQLGAATGSKWLIRSVDEFVGKPFIESMIESLLNQMVEFKTGAVVS